MAHLTSSVELSADAVAIMESDFDEVAKELRGIQWDFQWRQGLIAKELIAAAEAIRATRPDDVVAILVGSSASARHRMVGSVAVNLARHAPVPVTIAQ